MFCILAGMTRLTDGRRVLPKNNTEIKTDKPKTNGLLRTLYNI